MYLKNSAIPESASVKANNNNNNNKDCDNYNKRQNKTLLRCDCCAGDVLRGHQTTQITDFSIKSILGESNKQKSSIATATPPSSSNAECNSRSPLKTHQQVARLLPSNEEVLDLSKCKILNDSPSQMPHPYLHACNADPHAYAPGFWTQTARKLYDQFGQFLPKMFINDVSQSLCLPTSPEGAVMPETTSESTASARCKRYFAPFILSDSSLRPASHLQMPTMPLQAPPSADCLQPSKPLASELICMQHDCLICLQAYYKNSTIPMAWLPNKSNHLSLSPAIYQQSSAMLMASAGKCLRKSTSAFNDITTNHISLSNIESTQRICDTSRHNPAAFKPSHPNVIHSMISGIYHKDISKMPNTTTTTTTTNNNNNNNSSNSEEISYKCRICEKVFGCCQTLQAHEKTHKSPRYECTDCGKGFSQLRNYKYHVSVHRGTKEFAAECPECGKTFNDKGYLSSHMKIHRNKKEYECPYCPKSFNQRVAFNMHVRIHTGVKPHKCVECGKKFSRKMLLKQHMRTHSGEKPYQCSVCGKSFADRSNMTLHHRLHSGIKPFNCPICPKAFTKKHHLKTHLNYHTGCKPYVCPHPNCNQSFTQSSNMRTHAKKCQYRPILMSFDVPKAVISFSHSKANDLQSPSDFTATITTTSTTSIAKEFLGRSAASALRMASEANATAAGTTVAVTPAPASCANSMAKVRVLSSSSLVSAVQSLTFQSTRQQNVLFSPLRPFG